MEILFGFAMFVGFIALIGALVTVGMIWRGYVLHLIWAWLMVPLFGLPALSIPAAIAISLVVGFLTYHYHYAKDERSNSEKIWAAVGQVVILPAWVLLLAWVLTHFI